jgi:Flp pilus assembly protein TadG
MKRWRLFSDESGVSATEFAAISPVLAIIIAGMIEGWSYQSRVLEARSAVQAAAKYVLEGSTNDETIRSIAMSAWENRPSDGNVTVDRYCACGDAVSACSTLCLDEKAPATFVDIKASTSWEGTLEGNFILKNAEIVERQVLRVR